MASRKYTQKVKTSTGYDVLYPKTTAEQVITDGTRRFTSDAEMDGKATAEQGLAAENAIPKSNIAAATGGTLPIARGGTGNTTGKAATATKLATARTIAISGKATGTATSFDGSANITIPITELSQTASDYPTLNQNTTGSAATLTTARTIRTNLASTSTASFNGSANITPGVTGTLGIANGGTGATTAAAALTALGAAAADHTHSSALGSAGLVYGTCSTAAATAAKTVAADNFVLGVGARVAVTFTYAVPAGATLNVNGTGAKNIKWTESDIAAGIIAAGDTVEFVYTGSAWYMLAIDRAAVQPAFPVKKALNAMSWTDINTVCQAGRASEYWNIGDTKQITLSTSEVITVCIEDFNHDDLTGGGKAKMTLGMVDCFSAMGQMYPTSSNAGGWGSSSLRTSMTTVRARFPSDLQGFIKQVVKKSCEGNYSSNIVNTNDEVWMFSYTEVGFGSSEGTPYPRYISNSSRIKNANGSAVAWWLRSPVPGHGANFTVVNDAGAAGQAPAVSGLYISVGFCI